MDIVFGKEWFVKEQNRLLWLLNHSTYFRKDLGIQECDLPHNVPITEITPNSFSWGDRYFEKDGEWFLERTTDFRGTNKFAHRMYYAFYPVWNIAHKFDLSLANRFAPALNLGFDTLTAYPQVGNGGANVTCDGHFYADRTTWDLTHNATSADATYLTTTSMNPTCRKYSDSEWEIRRAGYTFDTTSLSGKVVSAVVFSLAATGAAVANADTTTINIVSFSPANNADFVDDDFDTFGTTSLGNINLGDWVATANTYNDISCNGSAINRGGITSLGIRLGLDISDTPPAAVGNNYFACRSADYGSYQPKLVVTYSVVAGPANLKSYNTNLAANIKSINTNLIANVKTLNTNA